MSGTPKVAKAATSKPDRSTELVAKCESLEEEVRIALDEARMVLPGIQALFGFQLVAVFCQPFAHLSDWDRFLHLGALGLVVVSIALIMTPAAYHRIAERGPVSRHFLNLTSRFMTMAMLPLMLAILVEVFVVSKQITGEPGIGVAIGGVVLVLYAGLWFVFPWLHARSRVAHPRTRFRAADAD
jgi:Family of unknown function (DUF6328)